MTVGILVVRWGGRAGGSRQAHPGMSVLPVFYRRGGFYILVFIPPGHRNRCVALYRNYLLGSIHFQGLIYDAVDQFRSPGRGVVYRQ